MEDDAEGDEPSVAGTHGSGLSDEMADATVGDMPLLEMESSDDQMPSGDMETALTTT